MTQIPPVPQQAPAGTMTNSIRRPGAIIAAVLLAAPISATWLFSGIAWLVVTYRLEGDGLGKALFWILAIVILALCVFLAYASAHGMVEAWRGSRTRIGIPAGFTFSLFFIALINMLVHGRISYSPTQIVPLVIGAFAGIVLVLIRTNSAQQWFAQGTRS